MCGIALIKQPSKFGQRTYYEGKLEGDGVIHKVILTQQLNQGQESVISAYNDLLHMFSPKIVFLVGIAGGIHNDSDYCDVVIAEEIIGYDKQKDTPKGILRRGSSYRIDAKMKPIIQSFKQEILKKPIRASDNSKYDTIRVCTANIGSGSAIIANELSTITEWIHDYNDKVFAVETEAYGFSTAFYEDSLNYKSKSSRGIYKKIFYRNGEEYDFSGLPAKSQENLKVALEKETLVVSLGAKLKISKLKYVRDWFLNNDFADFGKPIENFFLSQLIPEGFAEDKSVQNKVVNYFATFDPSIVGFNVEVLKTDEEDDEHLKIDAIHKIIDSNKTASMPFCGL